MLVILSEGRAEVEESFLKQMTLLFGQGVYMPGSMDDDHQRAALLDAGEQVVALGRGRKRRRQHQCQ